MKKVVYNLIENTREVKSYEIKRGCKSSLEFSEVYYEGITLDANCQEPYIIATFETKAEALEAIKEYESCWCDYSSNGYYFIKEYYIEEITVDEDDEFLCGGDVWEIAPMKD